MDVVKGFDRQAVKKHVFGEGEAVIEKSGEGLLVAKRQFNYSSLAVDLLELLGDCASYRSRYVLRLKEQSAKPVTLHLYYKITMEYLGLESTSYYCTTNAVVNGEKWTELSGIWSKIEGAQLSRIILYFIQKEEESFPDIEIKELVVEGGEFEQEITSNVTIPKIERSEKTTFGVIRWDAYFNTEETASDVSRQVARSLSPAHYHFMAPYFSIVKDKNTIVFGDADQAQFDQEAELAVKAGIDYFAYCWYRNSDPMSYARRRHMVSKYRDRIKMCAIINVSALDEETLQELYFCMRQDYYFTLDGRPVVYVYDIFCVKDDYISAIVRGAKAAGIKNDIYFAGMVSEAQPDIIADMLDRGYQAISAYGSGARKAGESFREFTVGNRLKDMIKYCYSEYLSVIPIIACGGDTRPRLENPVSWTGNYGGNYTEDPTGEELYAAAAETLRYMREHPEKNKPNTVLVYAWNEHDEGGWCCPTLAVDGEGEPIKDIDGKYIMNSTYLNALARALKEHREFE